MECSCAILSSVASPVLHFLQIISKRARFSINVFKYKTYVSFSLQILSETFLILRRMKGDMIKNNVGLHLKYAFFFSDFPEAQLFSTYFRNTLKY